MMNCLMYRVVASVRGSISPAANLSSRHLSPGSERKDLSAVQEGTSDWTAIKGVVFDMDGTLTIPTLDFVLMHERLNIPMSCDILASVNAMSPSQRAEAMRVIEEMEKEANDVMQLQPGVLELMDYLAEHRIQRAIMTRNTLVSVDVLLHNMREKLQQEKDRFSNISPDNFFSKIVTREFTPQKPHPAPVLHICECWDIPPAHVMVVGDHAVDITCGHTAGTVTAHLRNSDTTPPAAGSDIVVTSLNQLLSVLKQPIELVRESISE